MSTYHAPLKDMLFVLNELAGLEQISKLPGYEDAAPDTVAAILEEAAKFATDVLDPLNATGDREGAQWQEGYQVKTPTGFRDAYRQFARAGWNGLPVTTEFGGQGLPELVATAVNEMWHASNMAFALCPLLTQGAIEALLLCGTPEQKAQFLPKMVSGEWTGTMNLTEPQAGSDLAAVRCRAVPQSDGSFKLFGQKIFITYGEHDYTDNILHLVLARTPTAPEGVKGISLFLVPKFMVSADGGRGARNDVHCVSIEHKLGIHASPTAVLSYGDHGGAVGYLIGEENRGLEYMFIMMNLARFSVGLEGVGMSERAYQRALAYAKERVQGKAVGLDASTKANAIIEHPDVRRMLLSMKAQTEAMRALAYVTAAALDNAHALVPVVGDGGQPGVERGAQAADKIRQRVAEIAVLALAEAVTGHHHMAAEMLLMRIERIITIYEGTTGIQANDLIGRKTARDGGKTAAAIIGEMQALDAELARRSGAEFAAIRREFAAAVAALKEAVDWMVPAYASNVRAAHAAAVPFLKLWGLTAGAWQLARSALIAAKRLADVQGDANFYRAKIATARFYADYHLPQAAALKHAVVSAGESILALADDQF